MIIAPAYIAVRFYKRFIGFFTHWYGGGTRLFWGQAMRPFALLKNLFERSRKKSFAGLFLWLLRISFGALASLLVVGALSVLYIGWLLLPPYTLFKILDGAFL